MELLDALYFSVITLATIGYDEHYPSTPLSKIFTMLYIVIGVGVLLALIAKMAAESERGSKKGKSGRTEHDKGLIAA